MSKKSRFSQLFEQMTGKGLREYIQQRRARRGKVAKTRPHTIKVGGRKIISQKTHVTKNYVRERIRDPRDFDPKSFRIIDPGRPGHTKFVIACPKGFFKHGKCRVGTVVQAVLRQR